MALPKIDNTKLEEQGVKVIAKLDLMHVDVLKKLDKVSQEDTLQQMLVFTAQSADNLYNIAAKMDAQVTSLKETKKVLEDNMMLKSKLGPDEEAMRVEEEREKKQKDKPKEKEPPKQKSALERILEFFEKVLIPVIGGFVVGLASALGLFGSTVGQLATIAAIFLLISKNLRQALGSLISKAFKSLFGFGGRKPEAPGTGGIAGPVGPPGSPPGPPGSPPGPPGSPEQPKGPSRLEKFLEGSRKVGKSIKDLFVGIADTVSKVLGKLGNGIKQFVTKIGQGLKSILTNIAQGISRFGTTSVLKGAAALVILSSALFIAGKAFKEFSKVDLKALGMAALGILGLVGVAKLLDKSKTSLIKGAAALTIMSAALFIAGKAFQQFAEVDWKALAVAAVGIIGLTAAIAGLGLILPLIITGSAALAIMSVALLAFGAALNVVGAALPSFTEFLKVLSTLDGGQLISAAAGITAISVALAALGAGSVIGAIGNFASKILSFGEDDIFTKLTNLGKVAGDLNQLPETIQALGKLSNFKVSSNFMDNVDLLAEGLEKIAEAAEGFEDSGDALTALARIAEALNRPAPGGGRSTETKPGGGQPAPGKPATGPAAKPAGGQPAPGPAAGGTQLATAGPAAQPVPGPVAGGTQPAATGPAAQPVTKPAGGQPVPGKPATGPAVKPAGGQPAPDLAAGQPQAVPGRQPAPDLAAGQPQAAPGRQVAPEPAVTAVRAVPSAQPAQGNVLDRTATAAVRGATPPPAQTQGAQGPYSAADIQKQRDLVAKMPEGSAGRKSADAQLQKMESANKVAAATAQATPEQRAAVVEGRRVQPVQTAAPGERIMQDSQAVASQQGPGKGGATVVAPDNSSQSTINNSTSVTNSRPSTEGYYSGERRGRDIRVVHSW